MEIRIGHAIRRLRKERQMTLEQLGELAKLSPGHLSQIERGLAEPSLHALRGIAEAFGIPLSHLLLTEESASIDQDEYIRRQSERQVGVFADTKVSFEMIEVPKSALQLLWVKAPPGACMEPHRRKNAGEECALVISGRMRLFLDKNQTVLEPGDTVFIPAFSVLHGWENAGDQDLIILWVVTPPF